MRRTDAGFTLVEIIVSMVVLAIVAGMVTVFIAAPARGYADSVARAELTDTADAVLRRMARDIRLALPNSIRIHNGQTIEMLVTRTGGRYLAAEDAPSAGAPVLDFLRESATTFTAVGHLDTSGRQAIVPNNDRVVVFNLGPGFDYADAYGAGNSALVTGVDPASKVISLAANPFADNAHPPLPSPNSPFHVVREAVRYRCQPLANGAGTLTRVSRYTWHPQIDTAITDGITALAATRVSGCAFSAGLLGSTRASLVVLTLTLQTPGSDDGPVTLTHQLHVDNTP